MVLLVALLVFVLCGTSAAREAGAAAAGSSRRLVVPPAAAVRPVRAAAAAAASSSPVFSVHPLRGGAQPPPPLNASPRSARSPPRPSAVGAKKHAPHRSSGSVSVNVISTGSTGRTGGSGTATIPSEIFNLVKAIVGVGVLSLPAGIANFGDAPSAVLPAVGLIAAIGMLSGYGFAVIGKVCAYTGATSYRSAWAASVGSQTSWIPAVSTTCKTFLSCLAISMVLADTFMGLLQRTERTAVLVTLTASLLLPLCWLKNLSSLAPFSLAGIIGMLYTAVAMTVRYLDGSYAAAAAGGVGGALRNQVAATHLRAAFGTAGWRSVAQPSSLILVCMLSTAYMAHFNAPKFYQELSRNTLPRFHAVVASSFGIAIVIMAFITSMGFLTFGSAASGLVLNNYAVQDVWMSASRVAVAVSLVFSYPLAFQGCRDGVLDLLQVAPAQRQQDRVVNVTTVCLLTLITLLAAVLKDVSFVLAFGGGTCVGSGYSYCLFRGWCCCTDPLLFYCSSSS